MDKMATVPYVASSVLSTPDRILGRPPEERDIQFFFVGTARNRIERENLDVSGYRAGGAREKRVRCAHHLKSHNQTIDHDEEHCDTNL